LLCPVRRTRCDQSKLLTDSRNFAVLLGRQRKRLVFSTRLTPCDQTVRVGSVFLNFTGNYPPDHGDMLVGVAGAFGSIRQRDLPSLHIMIVLGAFGSGVDIFVSPAFISKGHLFAHRWIERQIVTSGPDSDAFPAFILDSTKTVVPRARAGIRNSFASTAQFTESVIQTN